MRTECCICHKTDDIHEVGLVAICGGCATTVRMRLSARPHDRGDQIELVMSDSAVAVASLSAGRWESIQDQLIKARS